MKVTIVLPTYNQADMLPYVMTSILNQTYRDFELIVVNDGSTDNTKEVLDSFSGKQQEINIFIIHQKNMKLTAALNVGFGNAEGRDYSTESRLCGRHRFDGRRRGVHAPEPERSNGGGHGAPAIAGILGTISSGGLAGTARRRLPVRPVCGSDGVP